MKRAMQVFASGFGLLLGALIAAVATGWVRFSRRIDAETRELLARVANEAPVVSPDMLQHLPGPVRRYLTFSGVVGKQMVTSVYIQQRGAMRLGPDLPWFPLEATQVYSVQPPGFVWDGRIHAGPVPLARGRDRYVDGTGHMLVKVGSLIPVVDATGPEMDQGSMMRYLSEMIWFPAAFLGQNISFEPVDDHSAVVTLADHGRTVSATMRFDGDGRLKTLIAQRYRGTGKRFELSTWETPVIAYGEFEGLNLPSRGMAVWKLPAGDFAYIDVEITTLKYNQRPR